jgi:hypothetical protein
VQLEISRTLREELGDPGVPEANASEIARAIGRAL